MENAQEKSKHTLFRLHTALHNIQINDFYVACLRKTVVYSEKKNNNIYSKNHILHSNNNNYKWKLHVNYFSSGKSVFET
jgi:hypothetical protein